MYCLFSLLYCFSSVVLSRSISLGLMSSESSSDSGSTSGSSSGGSSSESRTDLRGATVEVEAPMANTQGDVTGPSRVNVSKETETDVEVVEDGEEGESAVLVPAVARGLLDLTPVTYRLGRSQVKEVDLDKYVG